MNSYKKFLNQHGVVTSSKDTIVSSYGLNYVTSGELVVSSTGIVCLALNLEKRLTGLVAFVDNILVMGTLLNRLYDVLSMPVNPYYLGNVTDPLGEFENKYNSISGFFINVITSFYGEIKRAVELKAPGIIERQSVLETLITGILGIDAVLPLGLGQRELIIGDRQTGKTSIILDVILNQTVVDQFTLKYSSFQNFSL